jgi:hypothetical protein
MGDKAFKRSLLMYNYFTIFMFLILPASLLATTNKLEFVVMGSVLFLFGLFFAYANAYKNNEKVQEYIKAMF